MIFLSTCTCGSLAIETTINWWSFWKNNQIWHDYTSIAVANWPAGSRSLGDMDHMCCKAPQTYCFTIRPFLGYKSSMNSSLFDAPSYVLGSNYVFHACKLDSELIIFLWAQKLWSFHAHHVSPEAKHGYCRWHSPRPWPPAGGRTDKLAIRYMQFKFFKPISMNLHCITALIIDFQHAFGKIKPHGDVILAMANFHPTSEDTVSELHSYHEGPLHKPAVEHVLRPKRWLHGPDLQHHCIYIVPERHVCSKRCWL